MLSIGYRLFNFIRISYYAVVSRQDSVLIIGGWCDDSYTSRVAKYTVDNWTEVGNLQAGRRGHRAITNGNKIYIAGGRDTK